LAHEQIGRCHVDWHRLDFCQLVILPVRRVEIPVEQSRFRFILLSDPPEAVRPIDWPCLIFTDAAIVMVALGMIVTWGQKAD
jgi:hypothetical protein